MARARRLVVSLLAASVAAGGVPRAARADDIAVRAEPGYTATDLTTVDASGATSRSQSAVFSQKYRVGLDRAFTDRLRLSLGGIFDQLNGEQTLNALRTTDADRRMTYWGTLGMGDRILNAEVGYTRRDERPELRLNATARRSEIMSGVAGWNPDGLPQLALRVSRTARFAGTSSTPRLVAYQSQLSAGWVPARGVDLHYSLALNDVASDVDTLELLNSARASYSGKAFAERSSFYLAYDVSQRNAWVTATPGTLVATRQLPFAGLSLVESALTTPENARLERNPALIDGNQSAPTSLNIGYGPSSRGDTWRRQVGVEMADNATPLNLFHLYVDRPLDPIVASLYVFEVYRSDDNQVWVPVALEPRGGLAASYQELDDRFEIRFQTVRARYVKLVVRPLPVGASIDPSLEDVFLAELQTFEERAAEAVDATTSAFGQRFTSAVKTRLLRGHDLSWDYAGNATHGVADGRSQTTWFLQNALQYARQLARPLLFTARAARLDFSQADGTHEGGFNYGASLAATPLPTLSHVLTYSGGWMQGEARDTLRNALSLSNRAELYEGVSVAAIGSYSVDVAEPGGSTRSALASASATVTPHRSLTLTGAWALSDTRQDRGGAVPVGQTGISPGDQRLTRLDANASWTPFPALYLSGGVGRVQVRGAPAQNLYTVSSGFSPFQGGDLQLRFGYTETLDDSNDGRTRIVSPGLRWKIRRGTFLDVAYVATDTRAPVAQTRGRTFAANLVAPLW